MEYLSCNKVEIIKISYQGYVEIVEMAWILCLLVFICVKKQKTLKIAWLLGIFCYNKNDVF